MPFEIAVNCMREVDRVLKKGGLFLVDLYAAESGDSYEFTENSGFDKNTIKSVYNESKIGALIGDRFNTLECTLVRSKCLMSKIERYRYYLVLEKR